MLARGADEGETPKLKPQRARTRSNGAELLAAVIDAPVGKNLESRRVAPHERQRGMPTNAVCLDAGEIQL